MTRFHVAAIVERDGLQRTLETLKSEDIDDSELARWWAKAQAALSQVRHILPPAQEK